MCRICNKPCHATVTPSAVVKTDQHKRNEHKINWLKKYGGGLFDVIESLSRK